MRVAVTGTPGTGKTSATEVLEDESDFDLEVIHLNEVIEEQGLYTERDEQRDSLVADIDAVEAWLGDHDDVLVESHLAHYLDADLVVVLRCHPKTLADRLESRGESPPKVSENADSEALDVILSEAVERHGRGSVYELETTDLTPDETAREIKGIIAGDRDPSAGTVDYTEYL